MYFIILVVYDTVPNKFDVKQANVDFLGSTKGSNFKLFESSGAEQMMPRRSQYSQNRVILLANCRQKDKQADSTSLKFDSSVLYRFFLVEL